MTRYLLDSDTLTLYFRHHTAICSAVVHHLSVDVLVPIIVVEELWNGWQAVVRRAKTPVDLAAAYDRLTDTMNELRGWPVVSFGAGAAARYAALKNQKLNIGANDLKIAAIALDIGAVVVTRNARDFGRVPGITTEDWATG